MATPTKESLHRTFFPPSSIHFPRTQIVNMLRNPVPIWPTLISPVNWERRVRNYLSQFLDPRSLLSVLLLRSSSLFVLFPLQVLETVVSGAIYQYRKLFNKVVKNEAIINTFGYGVHHNPHLMR